MPRCKRPGHCKVLDGFAFEIKSWDEKPYLELADGRKFTRASVVLAGTAGGLASATFESLMYYASDGTIIGIADSFGRLRDPGFPISVYVLKVSAISLSYQLVDRKGVRYGGDDF